MTLIKERQGDWMQVNSGARFYPLDVRPEDINPRDIAHALSLLCRYGGHVDRFYSVAEHCVLMSEAVAPSQALYALLHDATEAYVVDVPRPVKRYLTNYQNIEDDVWLAITEHFGIDPRLPLEVTEADNRIILTERNALMNNAEALWTLDATYTPLPVIIKAWKPQEAEERYYKRLMELL
jgi:hypothetical protein